jgi:uncharacterized Fe-S radical SAM superfamily protein PflX
VLTASLSRAELERRAAEAHELLGERCVVCPRGCKVDRRANVAGLCAIGRGSSLAHEVPQGKGVTHGELWSPREINNLI